MRGASRPPPLGWTHSAQFEASQPQHGKMADMSSSPKAADRPYDLILFGATSFVGRYIAEYLLGKSEESFTWALAGRNAEKATALRNELAHKWPTASKVDIVVADAADAASLRNLAEQTHVVCTTVGPYAKYGEALVGACIKAGTHYCDLTGEVQFIRRMMDRHHEAAERKGVRIVHACGFDSIPSDIGTYFLQKEAQRLHGRPCDRVTLYVKSARGGMSGGTLASGMNLVEESRDREVRRWLADPYSLNPAASRSGQDGKDALAPRFDHELKAWTLPFFMGPVNKRVVRRSHALAGKPYGENFQYDEWMRTGKGVMAQLVAWGMAGGIGAFFGAASVPILRKTMEKIILPAPGEGPSRDKVESGHFAIELIGRFDDDANRVVRVRFRGNKDPGYGATAVMFAEAALCLALDQDKLSSSGGILTPAYAMGEALTERLQKTDCIQIAIA